MRSRWLLPAVACAIVLSLFSLAEWPEHIPMAPVHLRAAASANAALALGLGLLFELAQWLRARFHRFGRVWSLGLLAAALVFSWCVGSELVGAVQRLAAIGFVHVIALSLAIGCALVLFGMRTSGFGLRGSLGQKLTLLSNVVVMVLLLWAQHRYRLQLREAKFASVSAAFLLLTGIACLRVVERLWQVQSNGRGVAVLACALSLSVAGLALTPEYPLRQLYFAGLYPGRILYAIHLPELLLHRASRRARQARFLDAVSAQAQTPGAAGAHRERQQSRADVVLFVLVDALRADAFQRYVRDPHSKLHRAYLESCVTGTLYSPSSDTPGTLTRLLWRANAADGFLFAQAKQAGVKLNLVLDEELSTILQRSLLALQSQFDNVVKVPRLPNGEVAPLKASVLPLLEAPGPQLIWTHFFDVHEWGRGDPHANISRYDDSIDRVAEQISDLIDAVEHSQRRISVIVTADHGEGLDHFSTRTHGEYVYEPLIRVPLMLRTHGYSCPDNVISALRGAAPSLNLIGRLTLDELGVAVTPEEPSVTQLAAHPVVVRAALQDAIIRWPHKLIVSPWFIQLFDLSADPHELNDLSAHSGTLVRELRDLLEDETRAL